VRFQTIVTGGSKLGKDVTWRNGGKPLAQTSTESLNAKPPPCCQGGGYAVVPAETGTLDVDFN